MKSIMCGDVAPTDCDILIEGETAVEIKEAFVTHMQEDHVELYERFTPVDKRDAEAAIDDLLVDMVKADEPAATEEE